MAQWTSKTRKETWLEEAWAGTYHYVTIFTNGDTGETVEGRGNSREEAYGIAKEKLADWKRDVHRQRIEGANQRRAERGQDRSAARRRSRGNASSRGSHVGGAGGFEGTIGILIIAGLLIWGVIRGATYVVETYVIKAINPNYVTSFEKANQEAEARRAEQQARLATETNRDGGRVSFSALQGTSRDLTLRENIGRFSDYLRASNQLMGAFTDYTIVMPPSVVKDADTRSSGSYEIAFVGPNGLYSFHSSDGGVIWSPLPATDPYLRKLDDEYVNFVRNGNPLTNLISQVDADMNPALSNDEIAVTLPPYDWGSPPLSNSASRGGKPIVHWWLHNEIRGDPKLEGTIKSLAQAIQRRASGVPVTIYEYSQRGDDLWIAGEVSTGDGKTKSGDDYAMPRGFICHSADGGRSWARQWLSDNMQPEPVYGVYFCNAIEGWGLTIQGILYTNNGGNSWKKVFQSDEWCSIENLFILGKTDLLVETRWGSGHLLYSTHDRGVSWDKASRPVAKHDRELDDLQKSFGEAFHYGGIYSKELGEKE